MHKSAQSPSFEDPIRSRAAPGTVSICFVNAALEPVRARSLDVTAILHQLGLSPALMKTPQARVTAQQYGALWRLVATTLDDELFGQDSRRMKCGTFAMICHAALGCDSLRQALERALRFFRLVLDDISGDLNVGKSEAVLQLVERDGPNRLFGQECLLMLLHGLACWLIGRRIPIIRAQFSYAEPAHSIEYHSMFSTALAFQAPNTSIVFGSHYLALPVAQDRRSLKEFLRAAPEGILVKYKNVTSLAARVRGRLRLSLEGDSIELDSMASALSITRLGRAMTVKSAVFKHGFVRAVSFQGGACRRGGSDWPPEATAPHLISGEACLRHHRRGRLRA